MGKVIKNSILMVLLMTFLLGMIYPIFVTGISQLFFPYQANGSIIYRNGKAVGSELIGQIFKGPQYFQGRPSAAGKGYDAAASAGTNLGPTNPDLLKNIAEREKNIRRLNHLTSQRVPADLLTASASGLDPHISPDAAYLQAERIAASRNVSLEKVNLMVKKHIEARQFGILGEPRVNVLQLNLALDQELK